MNQSPKTVVALYYNHHNLPFGISSENPYALFCPDNHKNFIAENYIGTNRIFMREGLANSHFMFPVLEGLYNLSLPNVMAHVSINFDGKTKSLRTTRQTLIRLTTEPHDWRPDGNSLPIIVTKNNKITVESLCPLDYKALNPLQLTQVGVASEEETPVFWTNIFRKELDAEQVKARQTYAEARHRTRLFNSILK